MGQIVQPALNTATYPEAVTSADALKPWIAGAAGEDALKATQNLYKDYLSGQFASWLVNYQAARAEEPAPAPPNGFVAQLTDDGMGWDLIPSANAAGPVPAYQKRPTPAPSNPSGALQPIGGSRGLLVAPVGGRATQVDGTVWLRLS